MQMGKIGWKPNKLQIEAFDTAIRCGIESGIWEEEAVEAALKYSLENLI